MLVLILSFVVSLIPSVLIVRWLSRRKKDELNYRNTCKGALYRGLFCVLPVLGVSGVLYITLALIRKFVYPDMPTLVYQFFYKFIVLAFAEELVKFFCFKNLLKNYPGEWTWADLTAFMVIVGTGFGLIEDIPYAIGASPIIMLVRGITMGHVGYAFIMGWFYGKMRYTGKKIYGIIGFMLPFILHGLYDFGLSDELLAVNDDLAIVAVSLALLDLVLLFLMIRFFRRAPKREKYNQPLYQLKNDVKKDAAI